MKMKTKTIKYVGGMMIIMAAVSVGTLAWSPATAVVEAAAQARRVSSLKGVIKSINDTQAVIVPNDNNKVEVTFQLTSETAKTGAVAAGDNVTVSYYFEKTQRIATALAGKAS